MKYYLLPVACSLLAYDLSAAFSLSAVNSYGTGSATALGAKPSDRKAFLNNALVATFSSVAVSSNVPAWAEDTLDDLSMPSPEEQKAKDEAEMAARLARKAELQKKAARPISFTESLKSEKMKQKELEKSKAERRNALCEELGRGC
mmetsp:Transcript_33305/g.44175  ORF Transcript_33305/g.44175 Transcript_33305/m.44175 type:complete len:146 (-) Transcript_33305:263-700(-)